MDLLDKENRKNIQIKTSLYSYECDCEPLAELLRLLYEGWPFQGGFKVCRLYQATLA
jgi:hypothetical protein